MNLIFPKLRNRITILIVFIIMIPALWYHISLMGFNDDEAIRVLVAQEMDITGNFLIPTLNGLPYYAKPPLYNWILSFYCNTFGGYTEFNARTLSLLFLILFCVFIYKYSKEYFTQRYALINALMFLTCGRILFWDSMLAYIDIAYSMICYLSFMVIYQYHKKGNYLKLFLYSYGLMAIGYLMKGFPSIVFQGITLAVLFAFFDKWKNAFSWKHILGVAFAAVIVGSYYYQYNQYNSFLNVLDPLMDQSSRRTILAKGIPKTLKFILEFPFEYTYHFLPWSLMIILVFKKNLMSRILTHPFLKFCWYVFLGNIIIYWVSPGTIPRYVLMLMPLLFTVLLAKYQIHVKEETWEVKSIQIIFLVAMIGSILTILYPLVDSRFDTYTHRYWQILIMAGGLGYLSYRYVINPNNRLLTFILCIFIMRLGYNLYYLPERAKESRLTLCKTEALRIAHEYQDSELKTDYRSKLGNLASFYISNSRNDILPRVEETLKPQSMYISSGDRLQIYKSYELIDSFEVCETPSMMYIIRVNESPPKSDKD